MAAAAQALARLGLQPKLGAVVTAARGLRQSKTGSGRNAIPTHQAAHRLDCTRRASGQDRHHHPGPRHRLPVQRDLHQDQYTTHSSRSGVLTDFRDEGLDWHTIAAIGDWADQSHSSAGYDRPTDVVVLTQRLRGPRPAAGGVAPTLVGESRHR